MRSAIFASLTILSFGCTEPQGKQPVPIRVDTVALAAKKARDLAAAAEQLRQDSLIREQQQIAIGPLRFGMSKKEVQQAKKELLKDGYKLEIGTHDYMMYDFFTDADRLYRVQLFDLKENSSQIDTKVLASARNLSTVIEGRYGRPTQRHGKPEFFKFEPGTMQIMDEWIIGTKRILVGIVEDRGGAQYSAEAWIWDGPMQELVRTQTEEAERAAQKSAASQF